LSPKPNSLHRATWAKLDAIDSKDNVSKDSVMAQQTEQPAEPGSVHVEVVSDVVCPWCYIGKRRLEAALALVPDVTVDINWRPYFLNPWIPREGIDRQTYLETKFGSAERYAAIAERVGTAAAMEGLVYAPDKMTRQPNTLDCHRLILWSRSATDPARMKQRLMELYFAEGADLSDPKILIGAAVDCGMDGDLVRRLLASDSDVDRIEGEANSAKEAGIDGVPCFIFGGSVIVTGAQSPEYLANAIARVSGRQTRMPA
jgi:predicted DsbA family dithiol-disulfide isomerase